MELSIISPEKIIFKGEISKVTLPGESGLFTVLPHHAALISALTSGDVIYTTKEGEEKIKIDSGFTEVRDDNISVCIERVISDGK